MKIQTLSLIAGDMGCNAKCPFCISKQTKGIKSRDLTKLIDTRRLDKTAELCVRNGVSTMMITGQGEPTVGVGPDHIDTYLSRIGSRFPMIELQTNGLAFEDKDGNPRMIERLKHWYDLGLTTLAISVVHWDAKVNSEIICGGKPYISLPGLIREAHRIGLMVRVVCTMFEGGISLGNDVLKFIRMMASEGVEQVSFCPARGPGPKDTANVHITTWVEEHELSEASVRVIQGDLEHHGTKIMSLIHGASIYDVFGVSVCFRDCLTINPETEDIRQLIFYPSGRLRYDWRYKGAVLM